MSPQGVATLHELPCKQHVDFKNANYRRNHINLLLLDNYDELAKTYGTDGRPLEHATISAALQRRADKYKALVARKSEQAATADVIQHSTGLWQSAYAEGGQCAADCWKQVGSKRTPTGTFFGLGNPALPRAKEIPGRVPNMRPISLTQEVVSRACRDVQILEVSRHNSPANARGKECMEASQGLKHRPWVMAHQIGDRSMGRRVAKAVNAIRNPTGNFAQIDLPSKF